jgi:hypothetical protein
MCVSGGRSPTDWECVYYLGEYTQYAADEIFHDLVTSHLHSCATPSTPTSAPPARMARHTDCSPRGATRGLLATGQYGLLGEGRRDYLPRAWINVSSVRRKRRVSSGSPPHPFTRLANSSSLQSCTSPWSCILSISATSAGMARSWTLAAKSAFCQPMQFTPFCASFASASVTSAPSLQRQRYKKSAKSAQRCSESVREGYVWVGDGCVANHNGRDRFGWETAVPETPGVVFSLAEVSVAGSVTWALCGRFASAITSPVLSGNSDSSYKGETP